MKLSLSQRILFIFIVIALGLSSAGLEFYFIPALFFVAWLVHINFTINDGFNIRKIFVIFLALQYCLGTTLSYAFSTSETYRMVLPEREYFNYAFPAVLFMSIGLFIGTANKDEDTTFKNLNLSLKELSINDKLLTSVMFFSLVSNYILAGQNLPESLAFLFYLIFGLKYAYVCFQIITKPKINYFFISLPIFYLFLVTVRTAMFHDLVIWTLFWGISVCIRLKPKVKTVIVSMLAFVFFVLIIQLSKSAYRQRTWGTEHAAGVEDATFSAFSSTVKSQAENSNIANDLSENIMRINQGWILCRTMDFVPNYTDYQGMDLLNKYMEAAFLPRAFAPDKLTAGNREHFMKYTGIEIASGTSMGMGILADGWASYGQVGGWLVVFLYGLILNISLKVFERMLFKYPLVYFFLPLIYYYPIRPDCETQTAFGHLIKSMFFLIIVSYILLPKRIKRKVSLRIA